MNRLARLPLAARVRVIPAVERFPVPIMAMSTETQQRENTTIDISVRKVWEKRTFVPEYLEAYPRVAADLLAKEFENASSSGTSYPLHHLNSLESGCIPYHWSHAEEIVAADRGADPPGQHSTDAKLNADGTPQWAGDSASSERAEAARRALSQRTAMSRDSSSSTSDSSRGR